MPLTIIAIGLGACSVILAWYQPQLTLIPALVLAAYAVMTLWGMTNAMPREMGEIITQHASGLYSSKEYGRGFHDGVRGLSRAQGQSEHVTVIYVTFATFLMSIAIILIRPHRASKERAEGPGQQPPASPESKLK